MYKPFLWAITLISILVILAWPSWASLTIPNIRQRAAAAKSPACRRLAIWGLCIYLVASNGNNVLSFTELNGGQPILRSTQGDGGVRDPFILRSVENDKFYILATDLCIGCGTTWSKAQRFGSLYLEIWESEDLVTFSPQRHVQVSLSNYGNTWAPEAYYDDELRTYVVYWASGIYNDELNPSHDPIEYQRMVYTTTDDFITFSPPHVWQDEAPKGRIDSTVIKQDDTFYRFTKATVDGCART